MESEEPIQKNKCSQKTFFSFLQEKTTAFQRRAFSTQSDTRTLSHETRCLTSTLKSFSGEQGEINFNL